MSTIFHMYLQKKAFKNNKVSSTGWGKHRQFLPPVRIVTMCNGNNGFIFSGKNGNTKNQPKQQIKQLMFWRFCEGTHLPSSFLWRYSWCFGKMPSVCGGDLVKSLMISEGRFWGWVLWFWWGFYEDMTSKMPSGGVFGCLIGSDIMHHYL